MKLDEVRWERIGDLWILYVWLPGKHGGFRICHERLEA